MDDKNTLSVEQVQSGLYVVKVAYDGMYDYFARFIETKDAEQGGSAKVAEPKE